MGGQDLLNILHNRFPAGVKKLIIYDQMWKHPDDGYCVVMWELRHQVKLFSQLDSRLLEYL